MIPISGWRLQTPRIEHVGPHGTERLDRCRADERVRILVERAAEHRHLDARMLRQRDRDRRAVRDHRRLQAGGKVAGDLERRRARVEQDHLAVAQEAGRGASRSRPWRRAPARAAPRRAASRPQAAALRRAHGARALRRRAPGGRAGPCRATRRSDAAELGDDDLAVATEPVEDHLAPLFRQHHAHTSINMQLVAEEPRHAQLHRPRPRLQN